MEFLGRCWVVVGGPKKGAPKTVEGVADLTAVAGPRDAGLRNFSRVGIASWPSHKRRWCAPWGAFINALAASARYFLNTRCAAEVQWGVYVPSPLTGYAGKARTEIRVQAEPQLSAADSAKTTIHIGPILALTPFSLFLYLTTPRA